MASRTQAPRTHVLWSPAFHGKEYSLALFAEQSSRDTLLVALSRRVAAAIDAQPNHCALNAWRTLIDFPELFREAGHLVEGWCVIAEEEQVTLVEHVWCTLDDGQKIVDPSILLLVKDSTPLFYFSGLTRTYTETEALEGALFPHVRFDGVHGDDGLGHAGYKAARAAARRKVYTLALARKPPKAMEFVTARSLEEPPRLEANGEKTFPVIEGTPLDVALSLATSREIQAVPEQCWYNARQALLDMPNTFFTSTYIEGWVVGVWSSVIRVSEHGWIWTPRTGIVDPSMMLGAAPKRLVYLPGVQLSWLEIQQYRTTRLPLARERGLGGLDYQEACHKAIARAEVLAWQTGLPILIEPGGVRMVRMVGETIQMTEVAWDLPSSPPL